MERESGEVPAAGDSALNATAPVPHSAVTYYIEEKVPALEDLRARLKAAVNEKDALLIEKTIKLLEDASAALAHIQSVETTLKQANADLQLELSFIKGEKRGWEKVNRPWLSEALES